NPVEFECMRKHARTRGSNHTVYREASRAHISQSSAYDKDLSNPPDSAHAERRRRAAANWIFWPEAILRRKFSTIPDDSRSKSDRPITLPAASTNSCRQNAIATFAFSKPPYRAS